MHPACAIQHADVVRINGASFSSRISALPGPTYQSAAAVFSVSSGTFSGSGLDFAIAPLLYLEQRKKAGTSGECSTVRPLFTLQRASKRRRLPDAARCLQCLSP